MAKTYNIAVMPGDGTGPEVVDEGLKVLNAAAAKFGFKLATQNFDFGGERYKRTGETLPDGALDELRKFQAIFLGAIGHPDVAPGILEKGILLRTRFELDQYINLRPVKLYPGVECPLKDKKPEDIQFTVVRENTEGLYTGAGGVLKKGTPDEVAIQTSVNTRKGVERCIKFAFDYAQKIHRNAAWKNLSEKDLATGFRSQVTLVGKTNVLTYAFNLWERTFNEIGPKLFPHVKREYAHVDATCMWFVKNPEWFDVIVTDNMFGDIITDLGAMIQGGMGVAAGCNINPDPGGVSMFEPIGGSAPKYTGLGVINPLAAICAGAMMLDNLGESAAADAIEKAVMQVTGTKLKSLSAGKMGYSTSQVGDLVASLVA
jgi:3-isopropylmalate dehydrogenase